MKTSELVTQFMEQVWNRQNLHLLDDFLHPDFKDHSLPDTLPNNKQGLQAWVNATSASFEHLTVIEDQVSENDKCVIKVSLHLKHIGTWRDIAPSGLEVQTGGYRLFRLKDGKIIEHWALIDGQAIENQLKNVFHGCKLPE